MRRSIFISYKTKDGDTDHKIAERLYEILTYELPNDFQYDVFLDTQKLRVGEDWAEAIFKQLRKTHVLLVLLEENTALSDWVQREVDIARGLRVAIYPLVVVDEERLIELASESDKQKEIKQLEEKAKETSNADKQLERLRREVRDEAFTEFTAKARQRLAIMNLQFDQFEESKDKDNKEWIEAFGRHIELLVGQTLSDQRDLIKSIEAKNSSPEADKQLIKSIKWKNSSSNEKELEEVSLTDVLGVKDHGCEVILATGDILAVEDVDVIVNSENDYMQMARAFERQRVSGALRFSGAELQRGFKIIDDIIQKQLDEEIDCLGGRPIAMGEVLVTESGMLTKAPLIQSKARYIFHLAAVRVTFGESTEPLEALKKRSTIKKAVIRCLERIHDLNKNEGVLPSRREPDKDGNKPPPNENAKEFESVKKIIFPFFGTGHGGRDVEDVLPAMLDGIKEFLLKHDMDQNEENRIQKIYLSAYSENDLAAARASLKMYKEAAAKNKKVEEKKSTMNQDSTTDETEPQKNGATGTSNGSQSSKKQPKPKSGTPKASQSKEAKDDHQDSAAE